MLILLPIEGDLILEEKRCKKDTIRSLGFGYCKMIFVLLIEILISHIVVTCINIRKACFEKMFWKFFGAAALVFIMVLMMSCTSLFVYTYAGTPGAAKTIIGILKDVEIGAWALANLSRLSKKSDGNLDGVKLEYPVETQLYTLQWCPQVLKAIRGDKTTKSRC